MSRLTDFIEQHATEGKFDDITGVVVGCTFEEAKNLDNKETAQIFRERLADGKGAVGPDSPYYAYRAIMLLGAIPEGCFDGQDNKVSRLLRSDAKEELVRNTLRGLRIEVSQEAGRLLKRWETLDEEVFGDFKRGDRNSKIARAVRIMTVLHSDTDGFASTIAATIPWPTCLAQALYCLCAPQRLDDPAEERLRLFTDLLCKMEWSELSPGTAIGEEAYDLTRTVGKHAVFEARHVAPGDSAALAVALLDELLKLDQPVVEPILHSPVVDACAAKNAHEAARDVSKYLRDDGTLSIQLSLVKFRQASKIVNTQHTRSGERAEAGRAILACAVIILALQMDSEDVERACRHLVYASSGLSDFKNHDKVSPLGALSAAMAFLAPVDNGNPDNGVLHAGKEGSFVELPLGNWEPSQYQQDALAFDLLAKNDSKRSIPSGTTRPYYWWWCFQSREFSENAAKRGRYTVGSPADCSSAYSGPGGFVEHLDDAMAFFADFYLRLDEPSTTGDSRTMAFPYIHSLVEEDGLGRWIGSPAKPLARIALLIDERHDFWAGANARERAPQGNQLMADANRLQELYDSLPAGRDGGALDARRAVGRIALAYLCYAAVRDVDDLTLQTALRTYIEAGATSPLPGAMTLRSALDNNACGEVLRNTLEAIYDYSDGNGTLGEDAARDGGRPVFTVQYVEYTDSSFTEIASHLDEWQLGMAPLAVGREVRARSNQIAHLLPVDDIWLDDGRAVDPRRAYSRTHLLFSLAGGGGGDGVDVLNASTKLVAHAYDPEGTPHEIPCGESRRLHAKWIVNLAPSAIDGEDPPTPLREDQRHKFATFLITEGVARP